MKTKKVVLICIISIIFHVYPQTNILYDSGSIILENNLFKKTIRFSEHEPGSVLISSILLKEPNRELLFTEDAKPFFEFVINKELVTARQNAWMYKSYSIRKMGNGGEELKIVFEGRKDPVNGLEMILYQQIFPNTTLIREQLQLQATEKNKFFLNKLHNKLHFKFPQYSLLCPSEAQSTEIRIASWANELIDIDQNASYDERFLDNPYDFHNLSNCYMFHPQINNFPLPSGKKCTNKGPINIINTNDFSWITAYEHASQDNLRGLVRGEVTPDGVSLRDGLQGVQGNFDFTVSEKDFQFLGIAQTAVSNKCDISVDILRGGYLENEIIDKNHSYATVWTASAFHFGKSFEKSKDIIRDYLWRCICEKPASRKAEFYYNTWGMQRYWGSKGKDLRAIFTEEKIKQEIQYAAELGVDIFVLDDGWEQTQGIWTAHKERLPNGLKPIKDELDTYGIKMGIWFSPMGIDKNSKRYREHPEWVIKDSEGQPIKAQWDHPAFDFVSDFYALFIQDCKNLIDQGARFFKWDAINTFYSSLPNLFHGDFSYSEQERRERYEYLLPIYVTRAMKELTDYEPELIIEIDLTEARRVLAGLAVLSQGKYFWMNNGASGYNDYSVYRSKSMRTIVNQFAGIIPLELFTYANYPHNSQKSQRYNVNSSLIAGHGFWGALELMKPEERERVRQVVEKSKAVLPFIADVIPQVTGRVGGSPEIYTIVNEEKAAGQVIAFSGQALHYLHRVKINPQNFLAAINHCYSIEQNNLLLPFDFPMPDATREAFLLPNNGTDISIISSSSWLEEVELFPPKNLEYGCGAPGIQQILWPKRYGKPRMNRSSAITMTINDQVKNDYFFIEIRVTEPNTRITLGE